MPDNSAPDTPMNTPASGDAEGVTNGDPGNESNDAIPDGDDDEGEDQKGENEQEPTVTE